MSRLLVLSESGTSKSCKIWSLLVPALCALVTDLGQACRPRDLRFSAGLLLESHLAFNSFATFGLGSHLFQDLFCRKHDNDKRQCSQRLKQGTNLQLCSTISTRSTLFCRPMTNHFATTWILTMYYCSTVQQSELTSKEDGAEDDTKF